MEHMKYLQQIANGDVIHLEQKEMTYGGSWKRRGGVGAFMMLARKWDRLENILSAPKGGPTPQWDVFAHCAADMTGADGSVLAEVRDLRRYLLLVEAEILAQQTKRDSEFDKMDGSADYHAAHDADMLARQTPAKTQDGGGSATFRTTSSTANAEEIDRLVPRFDDPAPLEDSNRHADRAEVRGQTILGSRITTSDAKAFAQAPDTKWLFRPRPLISSDLYHALTPVARAQFRLCGKVAFPDRRDWRGADLELAPKYPLTLTKIALGSMPDWMPSMYEPRPGVEDEVQMKDEYRELWGR